MLCRKCVFPPNTINCLNPKFIQFVYITYYNKTVIWRRLSHCQQCRYFFFHWAWLFGSERLICPFVFSLHYFFLCIYVSFGFLFFFACIFLFVSWVQIKLYASTIIGWLLEDGFVLYLVHVGIYLFYIECACRACIKLDYW